MTTLDGTKNTDVADDVAADGLLEIQLSFDKAMARLALISQGWERSCREAPEQRPTSPLAPSAAPGAALPQAA
ncbi:hypothetical protein [Blastococcus sp. CT_GayMR16]|uniref:hypothetical protein n=1 Tax=Blastococcus sp. CT_GayMR16 TaxID=2559607 RepID=UPI0010743165|nr:hypothetical protein [Blastococcus sp. CT_GayMR16]TFV89910.1 hypothetical protein E4P38_05520 [Blastococcus sp. CT_GayMR16]